MKIATRNRLAEIMLDALDDPTAAAALRSLAASFHTLDFTSASQRLCLPVSAEECPAIVIRLHAFAAALAEWSESITGTLEETPRSRALRKSVLLFNHRLFFEVHEVLEVQWRQESGAEKTFFQGFIQIAVAFHHLENRNLRGTLALLHDGLEKLVPYQSTFLGIDLLEFVRDVQACQGELLALCQRVSKG